MTILPLVTGLASSPASGPRVNAASSLQPAVSECCLGRAASTPSQQGGPALGHQPRCTVSGTRYPPCKHAPTGRRTNKMHFSTASRRLRIPLCVTVAVRYFQNSLGSVVSGSLYSCPFIFLPFLEKQALSPPTSYETRKERANLDRSGPIPIV